MNNKWAKGYKNQESENERLREVNSYLNKEKQQWYKVVEVMQRAFDRVEKFLKGLSFWDKLRIKSYRNADFEQYKEFNPSDMITICMPTTKMCKNHEIDDLYFCSEFLC